MKIAYIIEDSMINITLIDIYLTEAKITPIFLHRFKDCLNLAKIKRPDLIIIDWLVAGKQAEQRDQLINFCLKHNIKSCIFSDYPNNVGLPIFPKDLTPACKMIEWAKI